jgi:hypothetical protein
MLWAKTGVIAEGHLDKDSARMGLPRPDHHGVQRAVVLTNMTGSKPKPIVPIRIGRVNGPQSSAANSPYGGWQVDPARQAFGR